MHNIDRCRIPADVSCPIFSGAFARRFQDTTYYFMRKSVGVLIVLWGLSQFFSTAFPALDSAARESFKAVETAAVVSQLEMQERF